MKVVCEQCGDELGSLVKQGNKLVAENPKGSPHRHVSFDSSAKVLKVDTCESCIEKLVAERVQKVLWMMSKKACDLSKEEWTEQMTSGHWHCTDKPPYESYAKRSTR